MPQFNDLHAAFEWWLENVYPKLPTADKAKLRFAKHDFYKRKLISREKMLKILEEYTNFEMLLTVEEKN